MTDKEIENFVNWLQSCTAKKFYSADAEDLIFEFKNQALSQHDACGITNIVGTKSLDLKEPAVVGIKAL